MMSTLSMILKISYMMSTLSLILKTSYMISTWSILHDVYFVNDCEDF